MKVSQNVPVIGIIGVEGKYGTWLKKHFGDLGLSVIGSDIQTVLKNRDVVEQADVVIFSLPISKTVEIISGLAEFSREDQLWMDVTSVKKPAVEAMMTSKAEVVGLHPMCAPTVDTLESQNLIVCRMRLSEWKGWLDSWLEETGACVRESTPEEHDKYAALVQALVHALALTFATTLFKTEADYGKLMEFATPSFRALFALTGRVLSQNPEMYAEIQMSNPTVPLVLETAANSLDYLHKVVVSEHRDEFIKVFADAKNNIPQEYLKQAQELFGKFLNKK